MKRLYVLFDPDCVLCQRCRAWLGRQSAYIPLSFIPFNDPENARRFPGVEKMDLEENLVVVTDEGAVYQGHAAWIMCLYALREYREWSQRLAHPALLLLTRRMCELISENRLSLSRLIRRTRAEIADSIANLPTEPCDSAGRCRT